MEKRLVVAIVLSLAVLIGYQLLFVKPQRQAEMQAVTQAQEAPKPAAPPENPARAAGPEAKPAAPKPSPESVRAVGAQKAEDISVETSLYRAVWSNEGGVLKSWQLKKYSTDAKAPLDLVADESRELGRYPFSLDAGDPALSQSLNSAFYEPSQKSLSLENGQTGEVRFEYSDGKSVRAEKIIKFTGGTYGLGVEVRVWKDGREVEPSVLWGPGIGSPSSELKLPVGASTGAAVYSGGKVYRMDQKKYKPDQSAFNFVEWAAYEENYFAAIFILPDEKGRAAFLREQGVKDQAPLYFLSVTRPEAAFIGPKAFDLLKGFGYDTRKVINFGMFGSIAEILLISVKYFHRVVPNWGLAIILLTIVIKIIFFPLTYSSTKSMARMAELQPKIKALRSKYKKAKTDIAQRRQMNEEMMKLYKEHGVNPAGGCLPLLIQLPIFWGVYRMLAAAVEFHHAPFVLWIRDLSVKDPYYVTPILMGITQFISQKMTPTSADPSQAKMMLMMPVVMTVFFMNFQSGLVLYWLTTNVLQIGQQAIMNRMMARQKGESDGKRRKN